MFLSGIEMVCTDNQETHITSGVFKRGTWDKDWIGSCKEGYDSAAFLYSIKKEQVYKQSLSYWDVGSHFLIGFLQDKAAFDNQGLTAFSLRCSKTKKWTDTKLDSGCADLHTLKCAEGLKVCGLRTRLMTDQGSVSDNLGIIDTMVYCCKPIPSMTSLTHTATAKLLKTAFQLMAGTLLGQRGAHVTSLVMVD